MLNRESLFTTHHHSIHSHYDFESVLGDGSSGRVVRGRLRTTGKTVAIKTISKLGNGFLAQAKAEMFLCSRLEHGNIVRLYEMFEDDNDLHYVFELCEGGELFDELTSTVSEMRMAMLVPQMLRAIIYCNSKNVAHRDIKPENFLFYDKERTILKLSDFGLSKMYNSKARMRSFVGTIPYAAPEVVGQAYGPSCDLWSLGITMYVMLCLDYPVQGEDDGVLLEKIRTGELSHSKGWNRVSPLAQDLVSRLLMKEGQRISAEEALNHPWITRYDKTVPRIVMRDVLWKNFISSLADRWQKFAAYDEIQQVSLVILSRIQRDLPHCKRVEECFHFFTTGLGVLTSARLRTNMARLFETFDYDSLTEHLSRIDIFGCGIELDLFVAASTPPNILTSDPTMVSMAFRFLDKNEDGLLGRGSLRSIIRNASPMYIADRIKRFETTFNEHTGVSFDVFLTLFDRGENEEVIPVPDVPLTTLLKRQGIVNRNTILV